jgi:hypothetical protein
MPYVQPSDEQLRSALETLARLVAPFVKDLLDEGAVEASSTVSEVRHYDKEAAHLFAEGLSSELLAAGEVLFKALQEPPHEVDSVTLGDWAGLSPRELSGRLLRPLGQQAQKLGLPRPWESVRVAPRGEQGARTLLRGDGEIASLLLAAFEERQPTGSAARTDESFAVELRERNEVPLPSAIFVYHPEYAAGLDKPKRGRSSCLRDSQPGTRAVIYRALNEQRLVAIFDVEGLPEWDRKFGWMARGKFVPLKKGVPRSALLADSVLEPVFRHIQGRRRLPPAAQEAVARLIVELGNPPLPRHSILDPDRPKRHPLRTSRRQG